MVSIYSECYNYKLILGLLFGLYIADILSLDLDFERLMLLLIGEFSIEKSRPASFLLFLLFRSFLSSFINNLSYYLFLISAYFNCCSRCFFSFLTDYSWLVRSIFLFEYIPFIVLDLFTFCGLSLLIEFPPFSLLISRLLLFSYFFPNFCFLLPLRKRFSISITLLLLFTSSLLFLGDEMLFYFCYLTIDFYTFFFLFV